MKRIAIFADGTWNSPEQYQPTNVLHMAQAVSPNTGGIEQVAFYDLGIGSDGNKITAGITGAGIDKNIMDYYSFIVHNYDPGDELYFFGFSRGAYTVLSLADFIRNSGLLRREHAVRIGEAYKLYRKLYRKRSRNSGPSAPEATAFRQAYAVADITYIEFVGVLDTEGALGIPIPFWGTLGEREFLFHDTEPSKIILHAHHAMSIDENRKDFEPTLWSEKPKLDLKQVWFAWVHSDIGGGYPQPGLSYCAAQWMIAESEQSGLIFEPHLKNAIQPDAHDQQHNERKGIYLAREEHIRTISGPVHKSVKQRWEANTNNYRSKSKALARLLDGAGGDWSKIAVV